jgi:hypothetical protein
MYTLAQAEYLGEKVARKVKDAEEKAGFKTGTRYDMKAGKMFTVEVSFYPKLTFWISEQSADGHRVGEREKLTQERYDATEGLRL